MTVAEVQLIFRDYSKKALTPEAAVTALEAIDQSLVPPTEFPLFMTSYLQLRQTLDAALVGQMGSTNFERIINSLSTVSELLGYFQTDDYDNQQAETIRRAIKRRTQELLDTDLPLPPIGDPNRVLVEAERESVRTLIDSVTNLVEWKVFHVSSISTEEVTVKSFEKIVGSGKSDKDTPKPITGALEKSFGSNFARKDWLDLLKNALVNGGGEDQHQYKAGMGVITAINCIMFQLMRTKLDGSPGRTRYSPPYKGFETFDRAADYYRVGQAEALVDYICTPAHNPFTITDANGTTHVIDISAMLTGFPPGITKILKQVALLTASLKNLGREASNYVQFQYANSPKLATGFSERKREEWTDGLLGRIAYKAGPCQSKQAPFIELGFMNLFGIQDGPIRKVGGVPTGNGDFNKEYAAQLWSVEKKMDGVIQYFRPKTPATTMRASVEFNPTRWFHDFPGMSDFMARTDTVQPLVYKEAQKAFANFEREAYLAPSIRLPRTVDEINQFVSDKLGGLFTQYAIMVGYMGKGLSTSERYYYNHQLLRSFLKWIILWMFFKVPGEVLSRGDRLHFKLGSGGSNDVNAEYESLAKGLKDAIIKQIMSYPSIWNKPPTDASSDLITGSRSAAFELLEFLQQPWLTQAQYERGQVKQDLWNWTRLEADGKVVKDPSGRIHRHKVVPGVGKIQLISDKEYDLEMNKLFDPPFTSEKDSSADKDV